MMEIWAAITGFPDYQVSNRGNIRRVTPSARTGEMNYFMVTHKSPNGYWMVRLRNGGIRYNLYVHRLVAKEFVDNVNNLPEVNHEDGDKNNNHYTNLIWTTRSFNNRHKNRIIKSHHNKIEVILTHSIYGDRIVDNLTVFAEENNLCHSGLSAVINGKRNHHGGWRLKR